MDGGVNKCQSCCRYKKIDNIGWVVVKEMAKMDNITEVICSLPDLHEKKSLALLLLRSVSQYPKHPSHQMCSVTGGFDAREIDQPP